MSIKKWWSDGYGAERTGSEDRLTGCDDKSQASMPGSKYEPWLTHGTKYEHCSRSVGKVWIGTIRSQEHGRYPDRSHLSANHQLYYTHIEESRHWNKGRSRVYRTRARPTRALYNSASVRGSLILYIESRLYNAMSRFQTNIRCIAETDFISGTEKERCIE